MGRHGGRRAPPAGAAARSSSLTSEAYVAERAAKGKAGALSPASPGRLPVCAPRHLFAEDADGDAHRAVRLSHGPRNLQPPALSSRQSFPGELDASRTCGRARRAARSIETAADVLRPDIVLPSAVRWVRRRLTPVRATLLAVVTLLPDSFGGRPLGAVRAALARPSRHWSPCGRADALLPVLPRPLGFSTVRLARGPRLARPPTRDGGPTPRHRPAEDPPARRSRARRDARPTSLPFASHPTRRPSPCFATG